MTPTEYLDRLKLDQSVQADLTNDDCKDFGSMLGTRAFRKVMHQMQVIVDEFSTMVANANLLTPEGVTEAVKIQGKREGFLSAIDMMLSVPGDQTEERKENG